ncbi:hypothetical protein [Brachybacterium phenoliresistens]|uniref:hypothetical protein n=1 Tax=Brachybacterium phenoliresistens TaxID=396014 RepID=UPI0031D9EFC4
MTNFSPSADIESIKKKALIVTIVGFVCGGVLPGILGLLGYLKADTEPLTAQKFTKWAWIVLVICWVLAIILIIVQVVLVASVGTMSTY